MEPIFWQTYEYEHYEKNPDWFWIAGILGGTLAIVAVIFSNLLFAVLIVMATVAIILFGNKEPHLLDCEINKKGVRIHKTLYVYSNLEAFNVTEGYSPKLILKSTKTLMPLITVPIGNVHPDEIIPVLSSVLVYNEELREPIAHLIMDHLGF
ncbi:MAG: hypothetical protein WCJ74_01485 [bacterium]